MIAHVVMFKFTHGFEKMANMLKAKEMFEQLPQKYEYIQNLEVGFDFSHDASAYDLCLRAIFTNKDNLIWFKAEPETIEAMKFLKEVSETSCVVDYELD
jgi:hypothetical protein